MVRETFEAAHLETLLDALLDVASGGALLDLGCADGLAARLAGPALERYVGVDLRASTPHLRHDLRDGLGPVGRRPFDLYLGSFGLASHLTPDQLGRLVADIARHAHPGALVALEALGLYSLEWPRLWDTPLGGARTIPYSLGADVPVHPWHPSELAALLEAHGVRPLHAIDRSVQAGPKVDGCRYWPGLPPLRGALNSLLDPHSQPAAVAAAENALARPLPPLPAGPAAAVHQALVASRAELVAYHRGDPAALARAVWGLEPRLGRGFGHGVLVIGRVA